MKKLTIEEVSEKHVGKRYQFLHAPVEDCYALENIGTVMFRNGNFVCDTGKFTYDIKGNKHYEASMIVTHILIWK